MAKKRNLSEFLDSYLDMCFNTLGGLILLMILLVPIASRSFLAGEAGASGSTGGEGDPDASPLTGAVEFSITLPVLGPPGRRGDRFDTTSTSWMHPILTAQRVQSRLELPGRSFSRDHALLDGHLTPAEAGAVEDADFGRVSVTASLREPRPRFDDPNESRLDATAKIQLPLDPEAWPLRVVWRLTVETPAQPTPAETRPFWKALCAQWDVIQNPDEVEFCDHNEWNEVRLTARLGGSRAVAAKGSLGGLVFNNWFSPPYLTYHAHPSSRLRTDAPWFVPVPSNAPSMVQAPGNPFTQATGRPLALSLYSWRGIPEGFSSFDLFLDLADKIDLQPASPADRTFHLELQALVDLEPTAPSAEGSDEPPHVVIRKMTFRPVDPPPPAADFPAPPASRP